MKHNFKIIAGPCQIESREHCNFMAQELANIGKQLNTEIIFKASYDKANRTSHKTARGVGIKQGLNILQEIKNEYQLEVITDVHQVQDVEQTAKVANIIQIPAFLSRQTDLLIAAGKTGKNIMIKKGQFLAPDDMYYVSEKVRQTNNSNIWLCERGTSFGYHNLVVDYRSFGIMKKFGYPVIFDATHSAQKPSAGDGKSTGDWKIAKQLALGAVGMDIDGIFMEVHDDPINAKSDGPNSIPLHCFKDVLKQLLEYNNFVKNYKNDHENFWSLMDYLDEQKVFYSIIAPAAITDEYKDNIIEAYGRYFLLRNKEQEKIIKDFIRRN